MNRIIQVTVCTNMTACANENNYGVKRYRFDGTKIGIINTRRHQERFALASQVTNAFEIECDRHVKQEVDMFVLSLKIGGRRQIT